MSNEDFPPPRPLPPPAQNPQGETQQFSRHDTQPYQQQPLGNTGQPAWEPMPAVPQTEQFAGQSTQGQPTSFSSQPAQPVPNPQYSPQMPPAYSPQPPQSQAGQGQFEQFGGPLPPYQPAKTPFYKKWWFWTIIALLFIAGGVAGGLLSSSDSKSSAEPTATNSPEPQPTQSTIVIETEEPTKPPAPTKPATDPNTNVPAEYESALSKATTYSDMMHMSKAGIYDQLTSEYGEGFSAEAAQYAIDNVVADWKANALESATSYNDMMPMSYKGLLNQLTSEYGEQFTQEEAQYAVDNLNADWNENALKSAQSYQDTMGMSASEIYDMLISEYGEEYTAEQAQYAIDHLSG